MRKLTRFILTVGIITLLTVGFIHLLDRALAQQEYKTCMQLPKEIKGGENCERFR